MKKIIASVMLACFGASILIAEVPAAVAASSDPFAGVEGVELSAVEEGDVEGGDLIFSVNRNKQTMTVISGSPMAIVNGKASTYTVPVTTKVVKSSSTQDKNAMTRNSTVTDSNKVTYYPTQLPAGTYKLDGTKKDVAGEGSGIHIDASVKTTLKSGATKSMNDYYVHASKYNNTWGCVGVKDGQMSKVLDSYNNSTGPKFLIIDSYNK